MSRRKRSKQSASRKRTTKANGRKKHPVAKHNGKHLGGMLEWLLDDGSIFSKMKWL